MYLWVTSPLKCEWFSQKLKKGQKINKSFINIEQKMDHFQCVTTWKLVDRLGNFFLPTLCLIPSYNLKKNNNIYPLTNLSTTRQKYEILAKKLEVSEKNVIIQSPFDIFEEEKNKTPYFTCIYNFWWRQIIFLQVLLKLDKKCPIFNVL